MIVHQIRTLFVLAGVAASLVCYAEQPAGPPAQDIPSGSTFKLRKTITAPAGGVALYFQDHQLIAKTAVQPDYVYGMFEIDNPPTAARKIKRQVFTVKGVDFDEREIAETSRVTSVSIIHLDAEHPADAASMRCQWPDKAPATGFVTVDEIRGALGGYFDLTRAP